MKYGMVMAALLFASAAYGDDAKTGLPEKLAAPEKTEKTITLTQTELTRLIQAEVSKAMAQSAALDVYKKVESAFGH